ncbi:MAG: carboxymuconolactone decarboxylase family protein [Methanosarcinaceae archaeon]|nr:carboxymuconolactone decarboxylase family protein [Methanosarcinaceae archaeon]
MADNTQEVKDIKGFKPRSIIYAEEMNKDLAEGISAFYSAVWTERENGLSMKNKHLLVFAIACSELKIESAVKILERLKKFGATPEEVKDAMMIAAWTGGLQNFTDFTPAILREMEKLGF